MTHLPPKQELTCTFKLLGRCGEQQFALHSLGTSTAGNAGLFVASLHPVRQPAQTAVTVQGVGTNRPERTRPLNNRTLCVVHFTPSRCLCSLVRGKKAHSAPQAVCVTVEPAWMLIDTLCFIYHSEERVPVMGMNTRHS